jgi:FkbM family methyltransferase
MNIPILIISYNNWKYVENTITQICNINPAYRSNIRIIDNASVEKATVDFLQKTDIPVQRNTHNKGPRISQTDNKEIYDSLPDQFILTDPDLKFNELLPSDFIEQMLALSNELQTYKIGFALDISDYDKMFQGPYCCGKTIEKWESVNWNNRINSPTYELYNTGIDTTFCLINKRFINGSCVRIAGNFTAKHLPWYIDDTIHTSYERFIISRNAPWSTIGALIQKYMSDKYLIINKRDTPVLVEKDDSDPNQFFWKKHFPSWENNTFDVFDAHLRSDKVFIDIGGWIGTTCIYSAHKSKHVYAVEADKESLTSLRKNIVSNCCDNITIIDSAIYNKDNETVSFGPNRFREDAKLNDSTSQLITNHKNGNVSTNSYPVKTITLNKILTTYNIPLSEISLIKVDIEGGEEYILDELLELNVTHKIPLYVSFHYTWWTNKDIYRFPRLTVGQCKQISGAAFCDILFTA